MAEIGVNIPGYQVVSGAGPIVILGTNGSGKTKLAQSIAGNNQVSSISAQRRTWLDETLPVQEQKSLDDNVRGQVNTWRSHAWRATEEINFVMSGLIQDHANKLTERNEEALTSQIPLQPTTDTRLMILQRVWSKIYPNRKLEVGGYFPRVRRLDQQGSDPYLLRDMSDGERTVLYMMARVLTATDPIILIDEPELHLHSRLAVSFWNEVELLRPDLRFVYVTHDLNLALSRKDATVLICRAHATVEPVLLADVPTAVAADVLGAATLPFYAKRIVFYEGEAGKGFASRFFDAWFDGHETFAIPARSRSSVMEAVSGMSAVGVAAAEIVGLVDRDSYSDSSIAAAPNGVHVFQLNEIESIVCDPAAIRAIANHLGKDADIAVSAFLEKVRSEFRGKTLNNVVASRVRVQVLDWLSGIFDARQIVADSQETAANHKSSIAAFNLPEKAEQAFAQELRRVSEALENGVEDILQLLPGKHLAALLVPSLGLRGLDELGTLIASALRADSNAPATPLGVLGKSLTTAFERYLPLRRVN